MNLSLKDGAGCLQLPEPSPVGKELLKAIKVGMPVVLPKSRVKVDSKKKLAEERIA